jgi:CDP-diacylglycerol--serine O-phosphatidyltransferase
LTDLASCDRLHLPVGIIAAAYAVFGVARLIYFTLDKTPIPGFFKGMPTPAAALFVTSPLIILTQSAADGSPLTCFWYAFCAGTMISAAVLMNFYALKYIHVGRFMDRHPWFGRIDIPLVLVFAFTPYLGHFAFIQMFLYALSPLIARIFTSGTSSPVTQ